MQIRIIKLMIKIINYNRPFDNHTKQLQGFMSHADKTLQLL